MLEKMIINTHGDLIALTVHPELGRWMSCYTIEELKELYQFYQFGSYCLIKWSITIPSCFVGNLADIGFLGFSKNVVDMTPVATRLPYFWEATRTKEKEWYATKGSTMTTGGKEEEHYKGGNFVNKGLGGLMRVVASFAVEVPANIAALLVAAVCTFLHVLLSPIVKNMGEVVCENMCGCR